MIAEKSKFVIDLVPRWEEDTDQDLLHKLIDILNEIDIQPNWELWLRQDPEHIGSRFFIQIQFDDPCNRTGDTYRSYCRKWYLSEYQTVSEIVRTVHKAYHAAVLHEADEKFKYKDVCVFDPHRDVMALVNVGDQLDSREQ